MMRVWYRVSTAYGFPEHGGNASKLKNHTFSS